MYFSFVKNLQKNIHFLEITTEECGRWNRQIAIMLVTYCYFIKVFSRSDDIWTFVELPIDKVVITK